MCNCATIFLIIFQSIMKIPDVWHKKCFRDKHLNRYKEGRPRLIKKKKILTKYTSRTKRIHHWNNPTLMTGLSMTRDQRRRHQKQSCLIPDTQSKHWDPSTLSSDIRLTLREVSWTWRQRPFNLKQLPQLKKRIYLPTSTTFQFKLWEK